jgi:hypothetical protein
LICWFTEVVMLAIFSVVISSITSNRCAIVSIVVSSCVVISYTMLLI